MDDAIIIVSGLPRSGTSMIMQMLEAGGLPVVTDGLRRPDEDNPRGYYEMERVKNLKDDQGWLAECRGRAIKVVSPLLTDLPAGLRYRLIFVHRDLDEIEASQRAMLERRGHSESDRDRREMVALFGRHLDHIRRWLTGRPDIRVLEVTHREVIDDPIAGARLIGRFLGGSLDEREMARVVDTSLFRQRKDRPGAVSNDEGTSNAMDSGLKT
ncbi:MAG: sulfotransferase domain-containing protein [Proteobacteria bacterium]|nr:sulfotransferase domain-containing protein [Pseudomonadota bacterium]